MSKLHVALLKMASKAYVASMTVTELKQELKQRGLSTKGSKKSLRDRLERVCYVLHVKRGVGRVGLFVHVWRRDSFVFRNVDFRSVALFCIHCWQPCSLAVAYIYGMVLYIKPTHPCVGV